MTRFNLSPGNEPRSTSNVSSLLFPLPRISVQTPTDRLIHKLVPGGMIVDFVDAMSVAIVGMQSRMIAVGLSTEIPPIGFSSLFTQLVEPLQVIFGAMTIDRRGKRDVLAEDIPFGQRGNLVDY